MPASAALRLLAHYDRTARALPWRSPPGGPPADPYAVWLSEIMLQQTTVAAVIPRFLRFVRRWPTVEALAQAKDSEILGEWAGLGYYARARNLIACAREIARRGGFPESEAELRKLPGVGDYTAAAIAAIAFEQQVAVVDTNVVRVIARLHGLDVVPAAARRQLRELVAGMTPADRPGDFAQAMMDLGATICRPKAPLCESCPLSGLCVAAASGRPEQYPAAPARRERPHRHGIAWWIEHRGYLWLVRRPASGLLGGMAALPGDEWTLDQPPGGHGPPLTTIRHSFTHFHLNLHIFASAQSIGEGWWQPLDEIANSGLPTLYRKVVTAVLAGENRDAA